MKRAITLISVLVLMTVALTSVSAAHTTDIEGVSLELVDGESMSYRVAIPEVMADFLMANGVSSNLLGQLDRNSSQARELSRAIQEIKDTELTDEEVDDDVISLNQQFSTLLAHSLGSAFSASGNNTVFMDLGTARYVRKAYVPENDIVE